MGRQDLATLYGAIGGHEAVAAVVDDFYRRLLGDADLAGYFAGVELDGLLRHQAAFIGRALAGPDHYRGRPLQEAHHGLGITVPHFERMLGHLAAALHDCGVEEPPASLVLSRIAALRDEVVEQ